MNFADYYKQFTQDVDTMGADEFCSPGNNEGWDRYTDQQLIGALTNGTAGVGDLGHELARRGVLDKVPGDNWGE